MKYNKEKNIYFLHNYYNDDGVRELCHQVKNNNRDAILKVALKMAPFINKNMTLIPIPNRHGFANSTLDLSLIIQSITDCAIADILKSKPAGSIYEAKHKNKIIDASFFNYKTLFEKPISEAYFIDFVYDTGQTLMYASKVYPYASSSFVFAMS